MGIFDSGPEDSHHAEPDLPEAAAESSHRSQLRQPDAAEQAQVRQQPAGKVTVTLSRGWCHLLWC